MKPCPYCQARGQDWSGDPPRCAFPDAGQTSAVIGFNPDNWNCALLNKLRQHAELNDLVSYNDDRNACLLRTPVHVWPGSETHVLLSWYKSRGTIDGAWSVEGAQVKPLTYDVAEAIARHLQL